MTLVDLIIVIVSEHPHQLRSKSVSCDMSGSMDSADTVSVEMVAEISNKHERNSFNMEIKYVTVALEKTSDLTDEKLQNVSFYK